MKNFNELSTREIEALTDAEWEAVSPFDKKSCADCGHIKKAVSLWCNNPEAIEARGTRIPGCIKCPYWKPDWNYIDTVYKTEENGYVTPTQVIMKMVIPIGKSFSLKNWFLKLIGIKPKTEPTQEEKNRKHAEQW